MKVPLESVEQVQLTNYLQAKKYTFSAIRNESDFNNMRKGVKRKREGVRKGIPDFCIILKRKSILFIELKRKRPRSEKNGKLLKSPSNVSKEQEAWVEQINQCGNTQAVIAYGSSHAIRLLENLEKVEKS